MGSSKDVQYYLALPCSIELTRGEDGWFAEVADLPGCMTQGQSAAEAVDMAQDAMAAWIEVALQDGRAVPEPRPAEEYSGKFVLRVPRSLHRDLARAAKREGVSLNQLALAALARAIGSGVPGAEKQQAALRAASPAAPRLHSVAEEEREYAH